MKNIEKYTNTKAALEAYNSIISKIVPFDVKNVPFDVWLECEYEEPPKQTLLEAAESIVKIVSSTPTSVTRNLFRELRLAVEREKAKPVRNCDKYETAEEAYRAFSDLCQKEDGCLHCRFLHKNYLGCALEWAYEEAEKEEKK